MIKAIGLQASPSDTATFGEKAKALEPSCIDESPQYAEYGNALAIDQAAIFSMSSAVGREGCIAAVDQFARDVQRALWAIEASATAGDVHEVRKTAHRLKGLFGQFGAPVASRMADRKSTRLNSSHIPLSRMPSSA